MFNTIGMDSVSMTSGITSGRDRLLIFGEPDTMPRDDDSQIDMSQILEVSSYRNFIENEPNGWKQFELDYQRNKKVGRSKSFQQPL